MADPKNGKNERGRAALPIYGIGLPWLLYSLRYGLDSPRKLIVCAILSLLVFLVLKGTIRERKARADAPPETPNASRVTRTQKKSTVKQTVNAEAEPVPEHESGSEQQPETQEKKGKYDELLHKLTEMDDLIPDPIVSAKLKQMRALAQQIFRTVAQQPEKEPQIRRLTEYYLPTTIRLLEHYVQMQDVQAGGENVRDAMEKISSLLDSMIIALQRQLDGLFRADVVDITADIRVMEQRLAAEGLKEQQDF